MPRRRSARSLLPLLLLATTCSRGVDPIVIGAVYPTGGGQGTGGVEEYRGLALAAEMVNAAGGVAGRPIEIRLEPADSAEGAPRAVERLVARGAAVVAGSYGSTISLPAAEAAASRGVVYWETGAVGGLSMGAAAGEWAFRFPPTGSSLGRAAVAFMAETLLRRLPGAPPPDDLRWGVAYVDDVYGRSVGLGALAEIAGRGLGASVELPYALVSFDPTAVARTIHRAGVDVLVVSAYLEDGVALRRALVAEGVPLVASIGTSSSYCHPEFGALLGEDAVGLFASDKPDGDVVDPAALSRRAGEVLHRARTQYRDRHGAPMSGAALSGFAAGWALFHHVLPHARDLSAAAVAGAIRRARLPVGALPNGSGLAFQGSGPDAGMNLRATSVIWEWVEPGVREVVWPPAFATGPLQPIPLS
jgi:branched-chain amino acid transport system substrate-binding protein